jgi:hypothetical protein
VARNWLTATHPTGNQNLMAVNIGRWNNYFNMIGNIFGTSSFSSSGLFQPVASFSYSQQVIYKLGFPNMGNNGFSKTWGPTTPPDYTAQSANQPGGDSHGTGGNTLQELDLNVKNTMIRHGNYDYLNKSIAWDATISDYSIPSSYLYTSKPGFFGNLTWPPFDPASPPGAFNDSNLCRIPAGYRYVHGIDPPGSAVIYHNEKGLSHPSGYTIAIRQNGITHSLIISYQILKESCINLALIDLSGHKIKELIEEKKNAGAYTAEWNGKDAVIQSGMYFIILKVDGYVRSIRTIVLK